MKGEEKNRQTSVSEVGACIEFEISGVHHCNLLFHLLCILGLVCI